MCGKRARCGLNLVGLSGPTPGVDIGCRRRISGIQVQICAPTGRGPVRSSRLFLPAGRGPEAGRRKRSSPAGCFRVSFSGPDLLACGRQRCCRRMTAKICCNRSQVRKLSLTHTHIACTVFSPIRTITAHNLYQLFLIVWIFDIYHLKGYLDPAQTRVLAGLLSRPLVCR